MIDQISVSLDQVDLYLLNYLFIFLSWSTSQLMVQWVGCLFNFLQSILFPYNSTCAIRRDVYTGCYM